MYTNSWSAVVEVVQGKVEIAWSVLSCDRAYRRIWCRRCSRFGALWGCNQMQCVPAYRHVGSVLTDQFEAKEALIAKLAPEPSHRREILHVTGKKLGKLSTKKNRHGPTPKPVATLVVML